MTKVFIDGREGTSGLQLESRLSSRAGVQLITLPDALRKDTDSRRECLNSADYVFLCLPDAAAVQAAELVENKNVKILDCSTAHRTAEGWAYGFPELSPAFRKAVAEGNRIAVPGCHASGFLALVYPLVALGIIGKDYPVAVTSLTGFSGGGKKMIADYAENSYEAPRQYALTQEHKHLNEMQKIAGLAEKPLFMPIVADYYCGMQVTLPLYAHLTKQGTTVDGVYEALSAFYEGSAVVKTAKLTESFLSADAYKGRDDMLISVGGNDERILLTATFDNLGKGASGAAVQCFNIMQDVDETAGLRL